MTYNNDSLYSWFLSQKKFRHKPIPVQQQLLKEYEGGYVNSINRDTIKIVLENEKLVARPGKNTIELKPSSDTNFFWDENSIDEVQFIKNKKGIASGFILLAGEQVEFRKIPANSKGKAVANKVKR